MRVRIARLFVVEDSSRAPERTLEQTLGDRVRSSDHFKEGIRAFLKSAPRTTPDF